MRTGWKAVQENIIGFFLLHLFVVLVFSFFQCSKICTDNLSISLACFWHKCRYDKMLIFLIVLNLAESIQGSFCSE